MKLSCGFPQGSVVNIVESILRRNSLPKNPQINGNRFRRRRRYNHERRQPGEPPVDDRQQATDRPGTP